MKRVFLSFLLLFFLLPLCSACGKYDYYAHVSDEKSDIFLAETEEFTVAVSCAVREHPFLCDGVAAGKNALLEAVLTEKSPSGAEYEIYFLFDTPCGGDMSFRSVTGDYYYSRSCETFPEGSVSLRVVKDGAAVDLLSTSVKTERTLSPREALGYAVEAEKETIEEMTRGREFFGEFHVRLLRRDKNYYYVGIISQQGDILALLLDGETGEVLARRGK